MEEFKNEFEKHERLTEFISEMASTGRVPREWSAFIRVLNEALSQHDVIESDCGCDGTCHDKITKEYKWCLRHSRL